jgi:hypothetical protein
MEPEVQKILENLVMTLSDPRGNWPFAWKQLCELADLDPELHKPHFAPNPVLDLASKAVRVDKQA